MRKLINYRLILLVTLLLGSALRLTPVLSGQERMLQHFPSEDGYLMLTIARNMALGNGMSVSNGDIATNGTQPLATWMYSLIFELVNADKTAGVFWILIFQWFVSIASAVLLFYFLSSVLSTSKQAKTTSSLAVTFFLLSPMIIGHTMNCLETGVWVFILIASFYSWFNLISKATKSDHSFNIRGAALVGLILGVAAWARIDAVFMIGAISLAHVLGMWLLSEKNKLGLRKGIAEAFIMGTLSVLIVSPWLISNKINFGSFTPISGTAQGALSTFGDNVALIPIKLFEYAYVIFGIPGSLEHSLLVTMIAGIAVLIWFAGFRQLIHRSTTNQKMLIVAASIMSFAYVVYYGLFFGAAHFLPRYFIPVGLFMLCVSSIYVVSITISLSVAQYKYGKTLVITVFAFSMVAVIGQNVRLYYKALPHMHWQVITWVENKVPKDTWVGAVQTGTLGYFHDRTINLDGKVNPEALSYKLKRRIPEYVVNSKIDYLVDWVGIAGWHKLAPITNEFDLIVEDKKNNLAVLSRKSVK